MNNRDAREFKIDALYHYNQMIQPLYLKYRQYNGIQIKTELLSVLTTHILSAIKEHVRKGKHRKLRFTVLKNKVKLYESEIGKIDELKAVEQSF